MPGTRRNAGPGAQMTRRLPSHRIGLISDTHGLLRSEALEAMRGCDCIIHAGDIGDPAILEALRQIAPLHAIRGNIDRDPWAMRLPERLDLEIAGIRVHVLHDAKQLRLEQAAGDVRVVVCGHSHQPVIHEHAGVLRINPGSAGPRRFRLPIGVGYLHMDRGRVQGELRTLG